MPSINQLASLTKKVLLAGGEILKRGAREKRQITYKSVLDPFTSVDVAIEKKVIGLIRKEFPKHGFLAEESAYQQKLKWADTGRDDYRWVIDPLDGTVNFVHHLPQSCVSIAVEKGGVILAGGVYDPYRDELFMAARGKGASLHGRPIHVTKESNLKRSLMVTGFPYKRESKMRVIMKSLEEILNACADVRRFGSAALDLSWVACGRVDGYWERSLNPWDVGAGLLLVEEAGGRVTNFKGHEISIRAPEEILASNGIIHKKLVRILNSGKN